ncbi:MAG: hypothetical protein ACOYMG_13675 [Candidatus Methylumidiphilus sp.]
MGKGDFPHQLVEGVFDLVTESLDVLEMIEDIPPVSLILVREMIHAGLVFDMQFIGRFPPFLFEIYPERRFQSLFHRFFKLFAALGYDIAESVAN